MLLLRRQVGPRPLASFSRGLSRLATWIASLEVLSSRWPLHVHALQLLLLHEVVMVLLKGGELLVLCLQAFGGTHRQLRALIVSLLRRVPLQGVVMIRREALHRARAATMVR